MICSAFSGTVVEDILGMETHIREYRCDGCSKLLFKGLLVDSAVEVKCRRCNRLVSFAGIDSGKLVCLKEQCPNRVTALRLTEVINKI